MTTRVDRTQPNPAEHDPECRCDQCHRLSEAAVPYGRTASIVHIELDLTWDEAHALENWAFTSTQLVRHDTHTNDALEKLAMTLESTLNQEVVP